MPLPRLTYQNKTNQKPIVQRNKQATAEDFNEIKTVVNTMADTVDSVSPYLTNNAITRLIPVDAVYSFNGSAAFRIKLPQINGGFRVELFGAVAIYGSNRMLDFHISCQHNGGTAWSYGHGHILTKRADYDLPIRFGQDNGTRYIYIGELNTSWYYSKFFITNVVITWAQQNHNVWLTGWEILPETSSFENITITTTNNLIVSQ